MSLDTRRRTQRLLSLRFSTPIRYNTIHSVDLRAYPRSHYCQQLTLSVCLSRALKLLLFCFSMESSHFFWPSVLHVALRKTLFSDFWFRPPNTKIYSQNLHTKSPISRLVRHIDRRCLGLPGGFRRWPIQWNHAKCCGPTLVAMATKFGLGAEIQSPTGLFL